ncbi:hypothetical protein ACWD33_13480 [Streptomyces xiamenensis]|uniref:Uncharacterized protein n=1 Tax=Streptomyces xiamenensis TaxID=408015 RepID=A0A0F7G2I2_9ACTN|nr:MULTISPECIES: hypothetical protein [Streptomyces]AKG46819.1 hypothetical protein SXIM_54350 [Streptomyces xiamenensis]
MENIVSVAIGAGFALVGVVFGAWFSARRQDRLWMRDQKLKAGVGFTTAVSQLIDYLRHTQLGDGGVGANELVGRMQEARSALYLLCSEDTVVLADALARRVWRSRPSEGAAEARAEHRETLDLLRRFTQELRQEIART